MQTSNMYDTQTYTYKYKVYFWLGTSSPLNSYQTEAAVKEAQYDIVYHCVFIDYGVPHGVDDSCELERSIDTFLFKKSIVFMLDRT